jgi:AcrR family transcriptional regulator
LATVRAAAEASPRLPLGRPRSEAARAAILAAAMRLLDSHSLRGLTIEAIARAAGVGKVTIYRWWPTKTHLVIDAFLELMTPATLMPEPGAGLADLTRHFAAVVAEYQGKFGRVVAEIIAEGCFDPDALDYFQRAMVAKRRAFAADIVDAAKRRGEVRADVGTELLIDLLYGPLYFRLLVGHGPLDARFARDLSRLFGEIAAPPQAGQPPSPPRPARERKTVARKTASARR